jgi:energy-coupling factor transporter ATP-binding protein EcfA2
MAERQPTEFDFLAVVSEWESQTLRGGRVGNAYPLLNLTTNEVVTNPREQFANAGAVFLISRGNLNAWDFISIRPRWNDRYRNADERDCCYIPNRTPDLLETPSQAESLAVVLPQASFDLDSASRQLINPRHGVTPLFLIQRGNSYYGPFARDANHLSSSLEGTVARIDFRAAREDGVIYEWTRDELTLQGIRLVTYQHPDPSLNRVLESPITFALGPVRKATSSRPKDALSEGALIDWYLQRCSGPELTPAALTTLRAAFRELPGEDPTLVSARLKKIEREFLNHRLFADHRERLARRYVESEAGQERLAQLFDQAVERKSAEIQAEVDRRDSQLASRREELARQLLEADQEHQRRLAELQEQRDGLSREIEQLRGSADQIQESLSADLSKLSKRVREQLPLFAALGLQRVAEPAINTPGTLVSRPRALDFRPIPPSADLRPIPSESKLVDLLTAELARQGLHFARDFIANIYVCLKAEPLNLVIGPPGYGKSMLVSTLAAALGHADALLRIAVRRSWGEDRHLLGYFDNFHGRYDPGTTGLVPRMLQAAADWNDPRSGIYLILLDEFNLAAPEYYFAQLLQVLPSEAPQREVILYEGISNEIAFPARIPIGPNLRFWGTINYDETTERLSPRTLDRTGMIFLGSGDVRPSSEEAELPPMPGVAASELFENYVRDPENCPEEGWAIISKVLEFLHQNDSALGPRLEISPRVRRGIKRYLANAREVLPERLACDFAIQQRILPVLRGRGSEFLTRVRRLQGLLAESSLYRSAAHVEEAIRRAEQQFDELDFLSY